MVAAAYAAACALALALGFDHISDDDYARVTIAQSFAHSPRLDPSGTSWLPFPFWALGTAMVAFGRSLAVARVASIGLASLSVGVLYLALRTAGAARGPALLAMAFATMSPWSVWLGAATVPESFTASLTAAAVIGLGRSQPRAHDRDAPRWASVGFALGLLAACLSRYEAWPIAAVLSLVLTRRALEAPRGRTRVRGLILASIVALGPLAWLAWNAHAHGDALHFFQRVARYRRALGEGTQEIIPALLLYPRLLLARRPDVIIAGTCALVAGHLFAASGAQLRRRWLVPLICVCAQLSFLAYGSVRDGAPTHHPERAVLGIVFVTAAFAADVLAETVMAALGMARAAAAGVAALVTLSWFVGGAATLRDVPGTSAAELRSSQIAAGNALREDNPAHLVITPCAYEHFALIAAFGAPERVEVEAHDSARVGAPCPAVERR